MDNLVKLETENGIMHDVKVSIPAEKIPIALLVEPLQAVFDKIVELEIWHKPVACKKGCSNCCTQMIPLSIPEVFYLNKVIEDLPSQHRMRVKQRFARNKSILHKAGLLDKLKSPGTARHLDEYYFKAGLGCPFLEADQCSIYSQRPLVCREYNVLSLPALCLFPYNSPIEKVKIAFNLGALLAVFAGKLFGLSSTPVAHIILMDWAEAFSHLEKNLFPGTWMFDQLHAAMCRLTNETGVVRRIL